MPIVSKPELEAALGKSRVQLDRLVSKGMPVFKRGSKGVPYEFDLDEVMDWYHDYETTAEHEARVKQLEDDVATEKDTDIKAAKLRKLNIEADRLQLKYDQELGKLVPIERVEEIVSTEYSNTRTALFAIGPKAAPLVAGMTDETEIAETLKDYLAEALEELQEQVVLERVVEDESDE